MSWLRAQREAKGWGQTELAVRLGIKSYVTISQWEDGHHVPGWFSVCALAELFGVAPEASARRLGWDPVPGDPCPCGCGGRFVPPRKRNGGPNECRVTLPCRGCGKGSRDGDRPREYAQAEVHRPLCISCSDRELNPERNLRRAPRRRFRCTGYVDHGKQRRAKRCVGSRDFTPGQIKRYQREGMAIDEAAGTWRCYACARADNVSKGGDRFLERVYDERTKPRARGVPKTRIRSAAKRREVRSTLMQARDPALPVPERPPSRAGATHRPESRELIGYRSLYNAWKKPGGAKSLRLRLCKLCGLLLMVETEVLQRGKRGLFHERCAREWRSRLGGTKPEVLGKAPVIVVPGQRRLGREGRLRVESDLTRNFRWLVLYDLGHFLLGEDVSYQSLASRDGVGDFSIVRDGIASVRRLLPPLELASRKFQRYLLALQAAAFLRFVWTLQNALG